MRVKDCESCEHCQRRVWSHSYQPRDYHAIGMSHAYAYCTKHQKRVRDVKKCEEEPNANSVMTSAERKRKNEL